MKRVAHSRGAPTARRPHRLRSWVGATGALLAGSLLLGAGPSAAADGTVTANKTVSATDIPCNGSTTVTLTLEGLTGVAGNPTDVMLVLDRSGSMAGPEFAHMKAGARAFVDIMDEATDGVLDGVIANGSRVGLVSFSSNATVNEPLTSNANAVKADINSLVASGETNHSSAFQVAQAQLAATQPANAKKLIMFTDGQTTVGGDASDDAAAARAAGTEIFAIGLGQVNVGELRDWATDPDGTHVFITPSSAELQAIFEAIGAAIVVPAATDVTVVDTVHDHFSVSGAAASKGTVVQADNVLTWTIDELNTETATLTYTAAHDPTKPGGAEQVNASITYTDAEGKSVSFPSPVVNVRGCPATISLSPETATNELGTADTTHTVDATVADDFGDPVNGIEVDFTVLSGPNAGTAGSASTGGGAPATFTYTGAQGLAGMGQDAIQGCFTNNAGAEVCDTVTKDWVDTTPPAVECRPTTNPSGRNVPSAGNNPKSGQNPDGFYELTATDAVDPNPTITLTDAASGATFGPFPSGTRIKLVQAPGATPEQRPGPGVIDWQIRVNGDALLTATDAAGNTSAPVSCLVPPPPK